MARDKAGNLQGVLGISGSGVNQHPGLDSLMFNPATRSSSSYGYIASPVTNGDAQDTDNLNYRWGDWNSAVLDPADGCTIWVAGEYLASTRTTEPYWYTQMASLPSASTCSGGPVLLSNVSLNFGSHQVGAQSTTLVETIKNNQSVPLNISAISTGSSDFTQTNTCLQQAVAPQGSCTISVTFTPSVSGARIGSLLITDDASNSPQTVALAGSGSAATLSLSATTLAFGNEALNIASASQTVTVTNNSLSSVTISSLSASGGYSATGNCAGTILAAGQTCTITAGVHAHDDWIGARNAHDQRQRNRSAAHHHALGNRTGSGFVRRKPHVSRNERRDIQRTSDCHDHQQYEPDVNAHCDSEFELLRCRQWNVALRQHFGGEGEVYLRSDLHADIKWVS